MKGNHRNQIEESMCLIVSYSVLLSLALSYSVLFCLALSCSVLLSLALSCSLLLCLTLTCSVLLSLALSYSALLCLTLSLLWRRANARNVSQHTLYGIQHIHINLTLIHCTFYCLFCVETVSYCVLLCITVSYCVLICLTWLRQWISEQYPIYCFDKDDLTFLKPLQWVNQPLLCPLLFQKYFSRRSCSHLDFCFVYTLRRFQCLLVRAICHIICG